MRLAILACAVATTAACGGGNAAPDADEGLACVEAKRGEDYHINLEHPGAKGQLDFVLMSAMPAPPGFSDNTWVVQVNAMTSGVVGAPATGATIIVTPFMPDHQHGTQIRAHVDAMPDAGQYKLSPVNLWMPGYWEITIDAQTAAAHDSVVYKFCIQA